MTHNDLKLIGRDTSLFDEDLADLNGYLNELVKGSRFLVIGGAGSIGRAVTEEIFKREPALLHVVDISENNLVELVRGIRSTLGYGLGDFQTFAIDCGGRHFEELFAAEGPYDYVLNLSALKHVRSESDPYTLMRLVEVNIFNTVKTLQLAHASGAKKYFCVSTDKAANPVNMMGASKRIMEMFLMRESLNQPVSMARFANVAFSDGSLLHGFNQRFIRKQPIAAPRDVQRYFVSAEESGQLCLLSALLGENRDIFFPKLNERLHLTKFSDIAIRYLEMAGFEPYVVSSEDEARARVAELIKANRWPCYFFSSDTTGEKEVEEFFTDREDLDMGRYKGVGVILNSPIFDEEKLQCFTETSRNLLAGQLWQKSDIVEMFLNVLPDFEHVELGKYLNERM